MNHKYTLSCLPGRMLKTSSHFLRLDEWCNPPGEIILTHGIMSEDEYQTIKANHGAYIYTCYHLNWVGIYSWHIQRKGMSPARGSIGFLRYVGYNMYVGNVHLNNIW